jgi:hypothetical protein
VNQFFFFDNWTSELEVGDTVIRATDLAAGCGLEAFRFR